MVAIPPVSDPQQYIMVAVSPVSDRQQYIKAAISPVSDHQQYIMAAIALVSDNLRCRIQVFLTDKQTLCHFNESILDHYKLSLSIALSEALSMALSMALGDRNLTHNNITKVVDIKRLRKSRGKAHVILKNVVYMSTTDKYAELLLP